LFQLHTTINLSAIASGTGGFVINGEHANNDSGESVSNAGDVNGDGLDDLIVGAYGADPSGKINAGKSYVIFGKKDSTAIELSAIATALETDSPLSLFACSPLITNPPVPLAIADKLIVCSGNADKGITYSIKGTNVDKPAFILPLGSAP
jgi:hypothetical protein